MTSRRDRVVRARTTPSVTISDHRSWREVTWQGCHGQGKKSGKRIFFQVREKSGNLNFSQENLEKNDKSQGKVREFKKFP